MCVGVVWMEWVGVSKNLLKRQLQSSLLKKPDFCKDLEQSGSSKRVLRKPRYSMLFAYTIVWYKRAFAASICSYVYIETETYLSIETV